MSKLAGWVRLDGKYVRSRLGGVAFLEFLLNRCGHFSKELMPNMNGVFGKELKE